MTAHEIEIDIKPSDKDGDESDLVHRWVCSCGKVGAWKAKAWSARMGGQRHQAMREQK